MTTETYGTYHVLVSQVPWNRASAGDPDYVARVVRRWAVLADDSALYRHLAQQIADDAAMVDLVARIRNTPPLNLLFAGVKLALTSADALAQWYPHLAGDSARPVDEQVYPVFRDFALERADWLEEIGSTRRTQTNEVARSAAILPWLSAQARSAGEPIHLVDIGASAGLNLCLDRFDYSYSSGEEIEAINPASRRLTLACENRGAFSMSAAVPTIATRHGIDLMPVDVTDPYRAAWLEALVWPEHQDRLERLRAAIAIRRETPVEMHAGDAATTLGLLASSLLPGPMVVYHTVMAYQLSSQQLTALDQVLAEAATWRPVVRVAMEPIAGHAHPRIVTGPRFPGGQVQAIAQHHGRWIDRAA